jgi:hypothetical protein
MSFVHGAANVAFLRNAESHPFDKGEPVHRSFHHKRRHHAVMAQSGNERDRLPMSMRRIADQPHATRAAASQPQQTLPLLADLFTDLWERIA